MRFDDLLKDRIAEISSAEIFSLLKDGGKVFLFSHTSTDMLSGETNTTNWFLVRDRGRWNLVGKIDGDSSNYCRSTGINIKKICLKRVLTDIPHKIEEKKYRHCNKMVAIFDCGFEIEIKSNIFDYNIPKSALKTSFHSSDVPDSNMWLDN